MSFKEGFYNGEEVSFSQPVITPDIEHAYSGVEELPIAPEPVEVPCPKIYAYIEKTSCVNSSEITDDIVFDLFVNVVGEGQNSLSGTIIKKIKFSKAGLVNDLEHQSQLKVNIVEAQNKEKDKKRMRELAGISHPKNYL
jgi:hypothetical protein